MRTDVHEAAPESLANKSFRTPSTKHGQSPVEISGFGVRVGNSLASQAEL